MDKLLSGMAENIGKFGAMLFSVEGVAIWLWLALPALLVAIPLLTIRTIDAPRPTRIARVVFAALPAFWLAVCAIVVTFAWNEKFDSYLISQIAFWVFIGLLFVMVLSGVAAIVMIRGWHRLTGLILLVVNLWIMVTCAFFGAMLISGVFL